MMLFPRTALPALLILTAASAWSQETPLIDEEALIDQIVAVDSRQRSEITDLALDAEYVEGKPTREGFTPEVRFIKRVYVKFESDTAHYREEYLQYFKDGAQQSPEETQRQAAERIEKNRKRKARNVSYPMVRPFYPEHRQDYEIAYAGIEEIQDTTCYHFRVAAKMKDDEHINGDYYFESDGFHLVRVEFAPAKLVSKAMFKLKKLDMAITYGPTPEGLWLPQQFDIVGEGKAALLFGVSFAGTEYYRNPRVNAGVPEALFGTEEESDDD